MSKLKKIDKLLKVKELRRRLAEMEAAKAKREVMIAKNALVQAQEDEQHIKDTSADRRNERLTQVIQAGQNPAVQNARLVNIYAITDEEIQSATFKTTLHVQQLDESAERLKLEQQKLARFLQLEERTKKLCERLAEMKKVEAARHE